MSPQDTRGTRLKSKSVSAVARIYTAADGRLETDVWQPGCWNHYRLANLCGK